MKILHLILSCFYVEGLGYQENILPKFHKLQGNEVFIITSTFPNSNLGNQKYLNLDTYINDDGIKVIKVKRKVSSFFGKPFSFNKYFGVLQNIQEIEPDIIFVHGLTAQSNLDVLRYWKNHKNVKVYFDNHSDYYNTPISGLKAKLINNIIWRPIIKKIDKCVVKYWGTTPWRCEYLHNVYGISGEKIDLLVMGADDCLFDISDKSNIRKTVRHELNISDDDIVIVTGGKIDSTKNILPLIKAVESINNNRIKLIVFGSLSKDLSSSMNSIDKDLIKYIGWIPSHEVYKYFLASDLGAFPGTHSVLWEQACGCGLPCAFKKWDGMSHVDIGGNCYFFKSTDSDSLQRELCDIILTDKIKDMKLVAEQKCVSYFSYSNISKRAIGL